MAAPTVVDKVLSRLLGRKSKTSSNIATEIAAQEAGIEAARTKIKDSYAARQVAIEDFDAGAHKRADEEIAEAGREIERREHAVEALKAAHCARLDVEAREAFQNEVAALEEEAASLRKRIPFEYTPAAEAIAKIVADVAAFQAKKKSMHARGKELGEVPAISDPEDFRGTPLKKQWSASWQAPEGGHTIIGGVEDAPRASIKWENDEPISTRQDVEIMRFRVVGGGQPVSLIESIGDLPKLGVDEGFFHVGYKFVKPEFVPLADRL